MGGHTIGVTLVFFLRVFVLMGTLVEVNNLGAGEFLVEPDCSAGLSFSAGRSKADGREERLLELGNGSIARS